MAMDIPTWLFGHQDDGCLVANSNVVPAFSASNPQDGNGLVAPSRTFGFARHHGSNNYFSFHPRAGRRGGCKGYVPT